MLLYTLVAFCLVLVPSLAAEDASKNCDFFCGQIWGPVCGSDGKTYSNSCELRKASCKDSSVSLQSSGECTRTTPAVKDCSFGCISLYDPVCGSDGKTYSNSCELRRAACKSQSITLKSKGQCSKPAKIDCPQFCIEIYSPVCGTDGKTYSNRCKLSVASCRSGKTITVAQKGRCGSSGIINPLLPIRVMVSKRGNVKLGKSCPSICFTLYAPVCGSDGKTYSNRCKLSVASCRSGKTITVAQKGRCGSSRIINPLLPTRVMVIKRENVKLGKNCPSFCFALYAPVCGSDGKTYSNRCKLSVASCRSSKTITVAQKGRCGSSGIINPLLPIRVMVSKRGNVKLGKDCPSICFALYAPVCGSDGKTYSNRCKLSVASCQTGKTITVAQTRRCGSSGITKPLLPTRVMVSTTEKVNTRKNCASICPAVYNPVCGSNGRTYSNSCRLSVESCQSGKAITVAHSGRC